MVLSDSDKILYEMGYYASDPYKKAQIEGYIAEAVEFMEGAGVPTENITSQTAFTVKSLWADKRDKGEAMDMIQADGLIVHAISQLRTPKKTT